MLIYLDKRQKNTPFLDKIDTNLKFFLKTHTFLKLSNNFGFRLR